MTLLQVVARSAAAQIRRRYPRFPAAGRLGRLPRSSFFRKDTARSRRFRAATQDLLGGAVENHLSAVPPGPGAHVHHPVGGCGWCPRRAPPPAPCCPSPACASGCSTAAGCPAGAGRCWARPAHTSTPTRAEPIWVARRMRWPSPPDRVPLVRSRVR